MDLAALLVLLAAAAGWDLARGRIPNALTIGGLAVAVAIRASQGGEALAAGGLGFAMAAAVALPLFAAGGLGGGDVKLLAAVGTFLGPERLVVALLVTAVAGGLLALAWAWRRGRLTETGDHLARLARRFLAPAAGGPVRTLSTPGALAIPYAVPIAVGALAGWFA